MMGPSQARRWRTWRPPWLLLLLTRALCAPDAPRPAPLHLVTFMNKPSRQFAYLAVSAEKHGLWPVVVGYGMKAWWPDGLGAKINALRTWLFRVPADDDIVSFVDAFDVMLFAGEEEIVPRFLEIERRTGKHLVFNAEKGCFPSFKDICNPDYPRSAWPEWRFLNSGNFIGRASAMKRMLPEPVSDLMPGSDQAYYQRWFLAHQDEVHLDEECLLVCAAMGMDGGAGMRFEDGRMQHGRTNSTPPITHFVSYGHWPVWHDGQVSTVIQQVFASLFPGPAERLLERWEVHIDLGSTHEDAFTWVSGDLGMVGMRTSVCITCAAGLLHNSECETIGGAFGPSCRATTLLCLACLAACGGLCWRAFAPASLRGRRLRVAALEVGGVRLWSRLRKTERMEV